MQSNVLFRNLDRHTPERVFATDLMTHISATCGLLHIPCESMCSFGLCPDTPFRRRIIEAVDRMLPKARILAINLYAELVGFNQPTIDKFELGVRQMGFQLNVDGFRERAFLEFCTTVGLMGVLARKNGLATAPNCAAVVIEYTVQQFKLLGGWPENAWEDIEREAEYFQY